MKLKPNVPYDVRIEAEGVSCWLTDVTWGGTVNSKNQIVLWDRTNGATVLDSWDRVAAAREKVSA